MSNPKSLTVTLALALLPGLATAWTPYGYDPYQSPAPRPSAPDAFDPGPAPGFEPMAPMAPDRPMGPLSPMDRPGSMRIEQSATDEAYLLDIRLSGVKPTEVKIEARGPWILVTRDTSAQASEEETFSDGRGYRRSFSYSSGRANRRFNVPRDGDTTAMQRQDTEDAIRIAIPRTRPPAGSR